VQQTERLISPELSIVSIREFIREDHPYLTMDDFMKAIDVELRKRMAN